MAVFYRTNALSRVIEDALRTAGVPYVIARGTAFYDREEIKNAIAYLRVVANQADDVSLTRIVNTPTRGIGKTSLDRVRAHRRGRGAPALRGPAPPADEVPRYHAPGRERDDQVRRDGRPLDRRRLVHGLEVAGSLHELVERVVVSRGCEAHYAKQAKTSQPSPTMERLDNLDELISSAREFEDEYDPDRRPVSSSRAPTSSRPRDGSRGPAAARAAPGLARVVALVADADAVDPAQGAVTLMTLHAAKGLEFPAVAMIGLEEGTLPHARAFDSDARSKKNAASRSSASPAR
jgi:DNA helicase-2/ATP-dependent DNA helicase PcrA